MRVSRNDLPSTTDLTHAPDLRAAVYPFAACLKMSSWRSSSSRASISQYSGMPALWYADISHSVSLSSELGLTISITRSGVPTNSVASLSSSPETNSTRFAPIEAFETNIPSGSVPSPAASLVISMPSTKNSPSASQIGPSVV